MNFGLDRRQLAIEFPFCSNSTDFLLDERAASQPDLWLTQIARETARRADCLEIVGHTTRGGPEALDERLSAQRAEYVMRRLAAETPALRDRMIATGQGSAKNLIGSGTDDARDGSTAGFSSRS